MAYNGWTNRETWNAELWVDNDEGCYMYKMDAINAVDDPEDIDGRFCERVVKDLFPNGTPDMKSEACFARVNWEEIADGWREEWAQ